MIHARQDYERIQDPAKIIPEDEPVFLLRAQDKFAWQLVAIWAQSAEINGASLDIVALARDHAQRMKAWPVKKLPDLPESSR